VRRPDESFLPDDGEGVAQVRVGLVGVSCVGKTTIGTLLAQRRDVPFIDLDEQVEHAFQTSLERLQNRFLTGYSYRKECARVLERVAAPHEACVIALPPSGLRDAFLHVRRRVPMLTVAVHDSAEHIVDRIRFYDIDSRPIDTPLSEADRGHYLTEIKQDIAYFSKSYARAEIHVDIAELSPQAAAAAIDQQLPTPAPEPTTRPTA
jgi:shikimate kinase